MSSWVEVPEDSDFSIANIPFGVFSVVGSNEGPHIATRIGNTIVDIHNLQKVGLLEPLSSCFDISVLLDSTLNRFMGLNRSVWRETRSLLISLLSSTGSGDLAFSEATRAQCLVPIDEKIRMHLPATIGDYTDFYSSREHATNVGIMFRGKDNALQPNWLHLPGLNYTTLSIIRQTTN